MNPLEKYGHLFCNGQFKVQGLRGVGEVIAYCPRPRLIEYEPDPEANPYSVSVDNAKLVGINGKEVEI